MSSTEPILKLTSQHMVDVIYDTLEVIDRLLRQANINYTLFCGTMLGSKRHGGLIPWDDDGDIAIEREDESRLLELKQKFIDEGYVFYTEPEFGYRIWHSRRTIVRPMDKLCIPFVDIFLLENDSKEYHCLTDDAKVMFPGEILPFGCFQRLIDVPFGHLTLRGLDRDDCQRHFDENFGTDWNEVAWRNFDHVTGDTLPTVRVTLDDPSLRLPALHSKHQ